MSQQVWTSKLAQELTPKDLIPSTGSDCALEIKEVSEVNGKIHVLCYKDLYRLLPPHKFIMEKDQIIFVAQSEVRHMDKIIL